MTRTCLSRCLRSLIPSLSEQQTQGRLRTARTYLHSALDTSALKFLYFMFALSNIFLPTLVRFIINKFNILFAPTTWHDVHASKSNTCRSHVEPFPVVSISVCSLINKCNIAVSVNTETNHLRTENINFAHGTIDLRSLPSTRAPGRALID